MKADLHIHSYYSDGMNSPKVLAQLAKENGVRLASVTDHDNFLGEEEKRQAFEALGIRYLSGIEVSAYENKKKVHLTGYAFSTDDGRWKKYQKELYDNSVARLYDVVDKLKFYKNIRIQAEEVLKMQAVAGIPVHTMHVVQLLKQKGYYSSIKEVFKDCFCPDLPTYSFVGRYTPKQAIDMIHDLGGVCCVAHPGRIDLAEKERYGLLLRLKEMGVDGMECVYSTHTEQQTAYFTALCEKWGLFVSGGSDFHSEFGSRVIGKPDYAPSVEFLRALKMKN